MRGDNRLEFFFPGLLEPRQGAIMLGMRLHEGGDEHGSVKQNFHAFFPDPTFRKRSSRCARTASMRSPVAAPVKTRTPSSNLSGVSCSTGFSTTSFPCSSSSISAPGFSPSLSRISFGTTTRPKRSSVVFMSTSNYCHFIIPIGNKQHQCNQDCWVWAEGEIEWQRPDGRSQRTDVIIADSGVRNELCRDCEV